MKQLALVSISLITLLGGIYFYQERRVNVQPKEEQKTSIVPELPAGPAQKNALDKNSILSNPVDPPAQPSSPLASILSFFQPERLNFLNILNDNDSDTSSPPRAPLPKVDEKTKTAIRTYIIASSGLFPETLSEQFITATEKAEKGDSSGLIAVRDTYRDILTNLRSLESPEETVLIHTQTEELLDLYIRFLDTLIAGETQETSTLEQDLETMAQKSVKIKKDLLDVVAAYNILLPPDTLVY